MNPPPQVEVHALSGELNTSSGVAVTVTLVPATGAVLIGKATANAVSGVATFDNLQVDRPGIYWLIASAPGAISTAESGSFKVFLPYHRIAAGAGHSCATRVPGPTYCWGDNGEGQLGLANEPTGSGFVLPQEVTGSSGLGFTAVATGGYHTCALTASGAVYCWGLNIFNQVGDGTTVTRRGPTLVHTPSGISFSAISVGYWHTCGVTAAGAAYCWGSNAEGALGNGTTTAPSEPVAVNAPPGVTFSSVSAGGGHSCGLTPNGAAYCWGENPYGGLGDGTTTPSNAPVPVLAGGLSFTTISAGDEFSCALTGAGVAYCWGRNVGSSTPVRIEMPSGVTISTIDAYCGLTPLPEGAIYCWGPTPQLVPAPPGVSFAKLDVGWGHACALTPGGAAYCWGNSALGNEFVPTSATPYPVSQ